MPWPKDGRDCVEALMSAQLPHSAHRGIFSERPKLPPRRHQNRICQPVACSFDIGWVGESWGIC
jgi:hypothetical protein